MASIEHIEPITTWVLVATHRHNGGTRTMQFRGETRDVAARNAEQLFPAWRFK